MKQIRLTKGLYALVDDADYGWLSQWTWCASHESRGTKWYAVRRGADGKKIRMHRAIAEKHYGAIPEGMVVDHTNHNSLDNQSANLEICTQTENMKRSCGWKKKGMKLIGGTDGTRDIA